MAFSELELGCLVSMKLPCHGLPTESLPPPLALETQRRMLWDVGALGSFDD